MEKVDNDKIEVQGYVVWVASGGQNGVEVTATVPAVFFVKKDSSTGNFSLTTPSVTNMRSMTQRS